MTQKRKATPAEIETLQQVLIAVLPSRNDDEMKASALECAKAVKTAFDELLK